MKKHPEFNIEQKFVLLEERNWRKLTVYVRGFPTNDPQIWWAPY